MTMMQVPQPGKENLNDKEIYTTLFDFKYNYLHLQRKAIKHVKIMSNLPNLWNKFTQTNWNGPLARSVD